MADPEKHRYHHREVPFLTRAARLLQFGTSESTGRKRRASTDFLDRIFSEKSELHTIPESLDQSASSASQTEAYLESSDAVRAENLDRRRHVRTLPPWIHSLRQDESVDVDGNERLTTHVSRPPKTRTPHRNHMPAPKGEPKLQTQPERVLGHARSDEAASRSFPSAEHRSKWQEFVGSSSYALPKSDEGEIVDDLWIELNVPDLNQPYISSRHLSNAEKDERLWLLSDTKRSATFTHIQDILMKNPFIPLIIRLMVMAFCLVALGLGVQIYQRSKTINNEHAHLQDTTQVKNTSGDYICKQQASTYMAFIVDSCAVVYLFFITYDEYASKPLGLRSSKAKMRLLFLDLFFIIFSAANLSLAFSTLTDQQWSCFDVVPGTMNLSNAQAAESTCITSNYLCKKQRALVSVLLVAEIAWVMTFAISTLRVVELIQR